MGLVWALKGFLAMTRVIFFWSVTKRLTKCNKTTPVDISFVYMSQSFHQDPRVLPRVSVLRIFQSNYRGFDPPFSITSLLLLIVFFVILCSGPKISFWITKASTSSSKALSNCPWRTKTSLSCTHERAVSRWWPNSLFRSPWASLKYISAWSM